MKRHRDAIAINQGACNPSGIAHSIIAACQEMRAEPNHKGTAEICNDPAIRLMVHQLAYICNLPTSIECQDYTAMVDACEAEQDKG